MESQPESYVVPYTFDLHDGEFCTLKNSDQNDENESQKGGLQFSDPISTKKFNFDKKLLENFHGDDKISIVSFWKRDDN